MQQLGNSWQRCGTRDVYVMRKVLRSRCAGPIVVAAVFVACIACCLMANGAFVHRHPRRVATNAANELTEVMIVCP